MPSRFETARDEAMVGEDAAYARLASPTDVEAVVRPRGALPRRESTLPEVSPVRSPVVAPPTSPAVSSAEDADDASSVPAVPRALASTVSNAAPDVEELPDGVDVLVDTGRGSNRDTMALMRAWTSTGIVTETYRQVIRRVEESGGWAADGEVVDVDVLAVR